MEEERNIKVSNSKIKVIIGAMSLLTIFLTPFLNITKISLNMGLYQSVAYAALLLGFWAVVIHVLRSKQPSTDDIISEEPQKFHQPAYQAGLSV
jgi:hypothetical protein